VNARNSAQFPNANDDALREPGERALRIAPSNKGPEQPAPKPPSPEQPFSKGGRHGTGLGQSDAQPDPNQFSPATQATILPTISDAPQVAARHAGIITILLKFSFSPGSRLPDFAQFEKVGQWPIDPPINWN
jgi:hypothetical protein